MGKGSRPYQSGYSRMAMKMRRTKRYFLILTVAIGAFADEAVKKVLNAQEEPLYIMPV